MNVSLFRVRFFLAVVLTITSSSIYSQRLIFDNIGVDGGLPATEAYHVFQDKKGYIWCFTEYGIAKHNGRSFVPSCKNLDLEHSAIYAVAENTNGEMYIANSKSEIYQVIDDKAYKICGVGSMTKDVIKGNTYIISLFFNDDGTLQASSTNTNYRFSPGKYWIKGQKNKKKTFKKRKKAEVYPYLVPRGVKVSDMRYRFKLKFFRSDGKPYRNWVRTQPLGYRMFLRRNKNGDYFGSVQEVGHYIGKKKYKTSPFSFEILDLEISDNGHVWVATNDDGLWEMDKDLNPLNHYFEKTIISDILFDNQNGMWVTSIGEGVFHCKNIHRNSFWNNTELSGGISRIEKLNNHLFIGTIGGNVFVTKNGNLEKINLGKTISPVYDVDFVGNRYFVGSSILFFTLNQRFEVERTIRDSCYAYSICKFENNHILVGGHGWIYDYNPETGEYKKLWDVGGPRNLERRNDHEIFFTNRRNIGILVDGKMTFPRYLSELKEKRISCIKNDRKGNIWFCTKGYGLYKLTSGNRLSHIEGIPASIINDIRFISGNRIVLSTNKGAFLSKMRSGQNDFSWERILYEEVVCVEEMAGKIYFGTKRGLIVSNADELYHRNNVKFYLNSVFVNSKKSNSARVSNLNYNENDLVFNYDFLNYHLTEPKIEYQLNGPVKLAGSVSDSKVRFQNLPPGEYVLNVFPKVDFDTKDKLEIVTKITISPAFWQTGWFQATIFMLIAVLLIASVTYFISRRNRRQRAKDEIEKLVTEHRLTALKAQVNPHFMSNSMVAIQRLIMEGNTDSANLYLAKFSLLLRSLLDYSSKSAASLQKELEMISLYVELEQLRFNHHFSFEINIDDEVDAATTYIPSLFTQPFVENAIWHGLLPLKTKRIPKLVIRIFYEGELLVISICDNGVGRGTNVSKDPLRKSHGSQLMFDRIEGMNKLYHTTDGGVKYIDMVDSNGNPAGTDVLIYFPEKILHELAKEI